MLRYSVVDATSPTSSKQANPLVTDNCPYVTKRVRALSEVCLMAKLDILEGNQLRIVVQCHLRRAQSDTL